MIKMFGIFEEPLVLLRKCQFTLIIIFRFLGGNVINENLVNKLILDLILFYLSNKLLNFGIFLDILLGPRTGPGTLTMWNNLMS